MKEPRITTGFKVFVSQKREIDASAKALGVDTSTYLRSMVLEDHPKLKKLSSYPEDFIFEGDDLATMEELLQKLSTKYPYNYEDLIISTLKLALLAEQKIGGYKLKHIL